MRFLFPIRCDPVRRAFFQRMTIGVAEASWKPIFHFSLVRSLLLLCRDFRVSVPFRHRELSSCFSIHGFRFAIKDVAAQPPRFTHSSYPSDSYFIDSWNSVNQFYTVCIRFPNFPFFSLDCLELLPTLSPLVFFGGFPRHVTPAHQISGRVFLEERPECLR